MHMLPTCFRTIDIKVDYDYDTDVRKGMSAMYSEDMLCGQEDNDSEECVREDKLYVMKLNGQYVVYVTCNNCEINRGIIIDAASPKSKPVVKKSKSKKET